MRRQTARLKWKGPRWFKDREYRRVLPMLFGAGPLCRIIVASIVVGAILCGAAKWAFPQLQFGFLWPAAVAIPAILSLLGVQIGLCWWISDSVRIDDKAVRIDSASKASAIALERITRSRLVVFSSEHVLLYLRVIGSKWRWRRIAVAADVLLDEILDRLPGTEVVDRRESFAVARRLTELAKGRVI